MTSVDKTVCGKLGLAAGDLNVLRNDGPLLADVMKAAEIRDDLAYRFDITTSELKYDGSLAKLLFMAGALMQREADYLEEKD